jgi:hypothetical protein
LIDIDAHLKQAGDRGFRVEYSGLPIAQLVVDDVRRRVPVDASPGGGVPGLSFHPGTSRHPNLFYGQVKALGRFFLGAADEPGRRTTGSTG